VRRSASEALGLLGPGAGAAAPALGKLLTDKNVEVRRAAVTALDQFDAEAKTAIPALKKALEDPDKFVRCQAMHAIGHLGKDLGTEKADVVRLLRNGLKEKVSEVRLAAIETFGTLGAETLGSEVDKVKEDLKIAARDVLAPIREAAMVVLKKLETK